jgi:ribonuclease D
MPTTPAPESAPDAPLVLPPGVQWVDTPAALAALIERVSAVQRKQGSTFRTCLDTEADSLHHYQEKLCLVQLAFGDEFVLIDPLAVPELRPLLEVLDLGELWLHGADYDLTLFKRTYAWTPRTLRDTQIAARLAGSRQFGLAALIEKHFGKTISKSSQKADWSKRPLPSTMLAYAVDDVRNLLQLADIFQNTLREQKRMSWFIQNCDDLRDGVIARSSAPKEDPWRIQGCGKLQPMGLGWIREMWLWREVIAQERDVPCFRIISNKQLLELALSLEAGREPEPPKGWRPRWKRDFESILEKVRAMSPEELPVRIRINGPRMNEQARTELDRLCSHRERLGQSLDIEPSLLAARATLEDVVLRADGIHELLPWQRDVLGPILHEARTKLGFLPAPIPDV